MTKKHRGSGPERPLSELISLKGRRAIVTGAATGIGKAIANRFAEAGADLILLDIDEERLDKAKHEFGKWGVDTETKRIDLSKKGEIDRYWMEPSTEPDILVNNAGIYPFCDFLEIDEHLFERVHCINLEAVLWMCQGFIRSREKQGGVIINVSSIEAVLPFKKGMVHYDASKAGIIGLTRGLARDFSGRGFRINALLPGGVITTGTRSAAVNILKGDIGLVKTGYDFMSRLPMGRLGDPDEIARAALYLASDLSSYVTGALLPVDGGFLSS